MTANLEPNYRQYQQSLHMPESPNFNKISPRKTYESSNPLSSDNQHAHHAGHGPRRSNRVSSKASLYHSDLADSSTKKFEANISRVKRPIGANNRRSEVSGDDGEDGDLVYSSSSDPISSDDNDDATALHRVYFGNPQEKTEISKKKTRKYKHQIGKTIPKTQGPIKKKVTARQSDGDEESYKDGFDNPFDNRPPKHTHRGSNASYKMKNDLFPDERPLKLPSEGEAYIEPTSPGSISLEPKFYPYNKDLDSNEVQHHLYSDGQDPFRSEFSPKCILRAAYGPSSSQETRPLSELPEDSEIWSIRIYSKPISAFLEGIIPTEVHLGHVIEMSYPFRTLVRNAGIFQSHTNKLENKYSMEPTFEGPELIYETKTALHHFRSLVRFMDKYLESSIHLYEKFRQGVYDKIKFPDLWMLYDTNSIIYTTENRDRDTLKKSGFSCNSIMPQYKQAYRVLCTTGGIPLRSGLMRMQKKERDQFMSGPHAKNHEEQDQHSINLVYSTLHVDCYCIDYNTKEWGVNLVAFEFAPFEGEMKISSLPAYPIHNTQKLWSNLTRRGQSFVKMTIISHWEHEGLTVSDVCGGESISGPVITDLVLASRRLYPNLIDLSLTFRDMKYHQFPTKDDEVTEIASPHHGNVIDIYRSIQRKGFSRMQDVLEEFLEELSEVTKRANVDELTQCFAKHGALILLPGVTVCYALRSRQWVNVDIENLAPVYAIDGWDALVLPKGHRELVEGIVEANIARNHNLSGFNIKSVLDSTNGHGNGSIILLHGVPGVGKTSTAECVAASTNRPLFHVTYGDIGHEPWQVEKNLKELFDLAYRWGCILLLEEADVFLARRNNENLHRNSITSVFLRALEYYSGILFLTTNHVGALDDAFHSRIHLTLHYPRLSKRQSYKIWQINIDYLKKQSEFRLQRGKPGIKMNRTKLLGYANSSYEKLNWDGRQIRNAFQTALALAESQVRDKEVQEPIVGKDEFRIIAASVNKFGCCVKQALYQDQDRMIHSDRVRADDSTLRYWVRNRVKRYSSYSEDEDDDDDENENAVRKGWRNPSGAVANESDSSSSGSLDESSDTHVRRRSRRIKSKAKGENKMEKEGRNRKDWDRKKDEGGFQR